MLVPEWKRRHLRDHIYDKLPLRHFWLVIFKTILGNLFQSISVQDLRFKFGVNYCDSIPSEKESTQCKRGYR